MQNFFCPMNTRRSILRREKRLEQATIVERLLPAIRDDVVLSDVVIPPSKLPDPWLYDSEKLLEDLDHIRECVLRIPLTLDAHGPINVALCAVWDLRERLTYLIGLHAAMQDDWKTRASDADRPAPAVNAASKPHPSRQRHGGRLLKRGVA
jgi:hypothetical protein